jgi:chemotaxis protein methyltransferase CheR
MMMLMHRNNTLNGNLFAVSMSDVDFRRLSEFIHAHCGIKMPAGKRTMLEGRLRKRLHSLGMDCFSKYCDYLLSPGGMATERIHMIDVVTTNKTDFFREPAHFDYLTQMVLPELAARGFGNRNKLNAWSAGCSSGEEAYTLAMVLNEFAEHTPNLNFSILATDISTKVLDKARRAVYEHDRISPVPMFMRKKYLLRSKNKEYDLVRIVPELRSTIRFQRLNFMEDEFGISEKMALIFCRNVLIYFDKPTQEHVLSRLCRHLVPGGYLFTGHSETLQGMDLPLINVATTVYRRL